MQTSQCPSQHELAEYDLGGLPRPRRTEVETHLDECAACTAALESLEERADELIQRLRSSVPAEIVRDDPELRQLVSDVFSRQETSVDSRMETQRTDQAGGKPPLPVIFAQLLQPAESENELGRLGDYRVIQTLGVGGMGVVFKAFDPLLKRHVALKALLPHLAETSPHVAERFLREAQAVAALQHDNVVGIYQVGRVGDVPCLTMPLLTGESLHSRLAREQQLSIGEALRIAREAAQGLAAAHAKGIIHRDIKPDNLWLETSTGECSPAASDGGRVKILDFGLARADDEKQELTQSGVVVGTPSFLSPEQARGESVDARSDLFSLGAVLYQVLTGRRPFARANVLGTLRAIESDQPPPPANVRDDVPKELSALVMRLLEKSADKRPASAAEVVKELARIERALGPPTELSNERKQPPRKWLVAMAAAAFAILLPLAIVIVVRNKEGKVVNTITGDYSVEVRQERPGLDEKAAPEVPVESAAAVAEHLPPMYPTALVQKPARLISKQGEEVRSWTIVPTAITNDSIAALSYDGSRVADFSTDGIVRVWDVATKRVHQVLIGHTSGPCGVASTDPKSRYSYGRTNSRQFGPVVWHPQNASRLATASRDGSIRVWDVARGVELWRESGGINRLNALAWSPDGTILAASDNDGKVRCLASDTGKEIATLLVQGLPRGLTWSPDSKQLAVYAYLRSVNDGVVQIWNLATLEKRRLDMPYLTSTTSWLTWGLAAMRWSPDGTQLAYSTADRCVVVVDAKSFEETHRVARDADPVSPRPWALDWSPNGQTLMVSWDGTPVLHNLETKASSPITLAEGSEFTIADWVPQSSLVALSSGHGANALILFDTESESLLGKAGYEARILEFSRDGRFMLSRLGVSGQFDVHRIENKSVTFHLSIRRSVNLQQKTFWSSDGEWAVFARSAWKAAEPNLSTNHRPLAGAVERWSPNGLRFLGRASVSGSNNEIRSVGEAKSHHVLAVPFNVIAADWTADGAQVAVCGQSTKILVFETSSGKKLHEWQPRGNVTMLGLYSNEIWDVAWSSNGTDVAVFDPSGAYVVNAQEGNVRAHLFTTPRAGLKGQSITWSPDGKRILAFSSEQLAIYKFDGKSAEFEQNVALQSRRNLVHFIEPQVALCGTRTGEVYRLDLATGEQELLAKEMGDIVQISPDGQSIATDFGGYRRIRRLDGQIVASFFSTNSNQAHVVSPAGHLWTAGSLARDPLWASKLTAAQSFVHLVETAAGRQTLTPLEFADRYGWQNDPTAVRIR